MAKKFTRLQRVEPDAAPPGALSDSDSDNSWSDGDLVALLNTKALGSSGRGTTATASSAAASASTTRLDTSGRAGEVRAPTGAPLRGRPLPWPESPPRRPSRSGHAPKQNTNRSPMLNMSAAAFAGSLRTPSGNHSPSGRIQAHTHRWGGLTGPGTTTDHTLPSPSSAATGSATGTGAGAGSGAQVGTHTTAPPAVNPKSPTFRDRVARDREEAARQKEHTKQARLTARMDAKEGLKSLHRLTPYLNSPSSRFATTDPLYSCESEALLGVSLGDLSGVSRADSDGEIKSLSTSLSSAPSSSFAGGGGSSSGRGGRRKKGAKRSARNKQVVYLGKMPARMAHKAHKARGKGGGGDGRDRGAGVGVAAFHGRAKRRGVRKVRSSYVGGVTIVMKQKRWKPSGGMIGPPSHSEARAERRQTRAAQADGNVHKSGAKRGRRRGAGGREGREERKGRGGRDSGGDAPSPPPPSYPSVRPVPMEGIEDISRAGGGGVGGGGNGGSESNRVGDEELRVERQSQQQQSVQSVVADTAEREGDGSEGRFVPPLNYDSG